MQAAINRAALLRCGVLAAVLQTAAKRCKPLQSVANRCKVLRSVAKLHSQVVSLGLLAEVYRRKGESAKAISFYKRACMVPLCGTHRAAVGYRAAQTHSPWVHTTGGTGGWALAQFTYWSWLSVFVATLCTILQHSASVTGGA